jgi:Tn3 transposase DDE domain
VTHKNVHGSARLGRGLVALSIEDKVFRADTTDVLNKGEARHTLSRAIAFHQLGRFRDRSHERQSHRAAALNLITASIGLLWHGLGTNPAGSASALGPGPVMGGSQAEASCRDRR